MKTVRISPEELAEHHQFMRGTSFANATLRPQNDEMRLAMSVAVDRPDIATEDGFAAWILDLTIEAYCDGNL